MRHIAKFTVLLVFIFCFSCDKDNDPESISNNTLTFLKSENNVLRNQEIEFYLMEEKTDITSSASFYVNDSAIEGNIFSSSDEGSFQVYAKYSNGETTVSTQIDSFKVYIPRKKALIEGFTGTWCGNCPNYDLLVERAIDSIEELVVVSIHGGDQDPYTTLEGMVLKDFLNSPGYPTGYIDRGPDYWSNYIVNLYPLEEVTPFAGFDTDISIKIESQLNDDILAIQVNAISEKKISNTKMVVFLLEDGLLYDQVNYRNDDPRFPSYNMGDPIINFEHNHVLRMALTNPLGDEIPETSALTEYNRNFNINISSGFNPSNLKLVVTLLDENNLVRNTQQAKVNQFQDYE